MSKSIAIARRGVLLILSSPSGAGKTTLSRLLLEQDSEITMSVSATTRPRRTAEVDGRDYRFLDRATYDKMVSRHEFLEHAEVFGNGYGTPREPVEAAMEAGRDMLFDVDWQGAEQLKRSVGGDVASVFILPPSIEELERRLRGRAQDSDEVVAKRMAQARAEMSHWRDYDYVLINQDVQLCLEQLKAVLSAERLRRRRQVGLDAFMAEMKVK
jgi:guanylate kinase